MSKVRRKINKINRESERSKNRAERSRKNYAKILFVLILVFCACEVFAIVTAKNEYDHKSARRVAEELSVELDLIASPFRSGNRTLYDNSLERYQSSLATFADNDYVRTHQVDLLNNLRNYSSTLKQNEKDTKELLELDAALVGFRSELQSVEFKQLDASNFYQLQQAFQTLRDAIVNIDADDNKEMRDSIEAYATKMQELSKNSAICVSVCPKDSFAEKQKKLESYRDKYLEEFEKLDKKISDKYNPSALIVELGKI